MPVQLATAEIRSMGFKEDQFSPYDLPSFHKKVATMRIEQERQV
jgi:hypothetical protein